MPHSIQYEIVRAVVPGYTAGTFHTFAPKLRDKDMSRKSHRKRSMSLGGQPYTTYYYGATSWDCDTTAVGGTAAALIEMFLQSVEDGQIFKFDPYNAPGASPGAYRNVIVDGDSYAPARRVRRGDGGAADLFTYTFKLLEIP